MPEVLSTSEGTVYSYTDRPRPVNNLFIYLFIYFLDVFFSNWEKEIGEKDMKSLTGCLQSA